MVPVPDVSRRSAHWLQPDWRSRRSAMSRRSRTTAAGRRSVDACSNEGTEMATQPQVSEAAPLTGLVPMIRVADVERSAAFYGLLGFEIGNKVPRTGTPHWAWLYAPKVDNWKHGPNLMVVRG